VKTQPVRVTTQRKTDRNHIDFETEVFSKAHWNQFEQVLDQFDPI